MFVPSGGVWNIVKMLSNNQQHFFDKIKRVVACDIEMHHLQAIMVCEGMGAMWLQKYYTSPDFRPLCYRTLNCWPYCGLGVCAV